MKWGHTILFSVLGAPEAGHLTGAFLAFHETFADHVAAMSSLYFTSVRERLLRQTNGNLYALNLVSRVGELSGSDEIRVLDNDVTLSDLAGLRLGPDGHWNDASGIGRDQHAGSMPMSGAIWDCFVELFQDAAVRRGVIAPRHDTRRWTKARVTAALAELHTASGMALRRFRAEFDVALREARDLTATALARCIQRLDANDLDFKTVAARFCEALVELGQSRVLPALIENFQDREIDPTAKLRRTPAAGVAWAAIPPGQRLRYVSAINGCLGCRMPQTVASVSRLIRHPHRGAAALSGL
jgi:hypothetical protein